MHPKRFLLAMVKTPKMLAPKPQETASNQKELVQ
jgi:hypothetical protein